MKSHGKSKAVLSAIIFEVNLLQSSRFGDAYNAEIQTWINASKTGYVDGPTAWDGYCCQVAAAAASKARETQTIQPVVYDEMPDFYKA